MVMNVTGNNKGRRIEVGRKMSLKEEIFEQIDKGVEGTSHGDT